MCWFWSDKAGLGMAGHSDSTKSSFPLGFILLAASQCVAGRTVTNAGPDSHAPRPARRVEERKGFFLLQVKYPSTEGAKKNVRT